MAFNALRVEKRHGPLVDLTITNRGHTYKVTEAQRAIVEYVRAHTEASYREVAAAVGLCASTVLRDMRQLKQLGVASAVTTGAGRAARTVWTVAKDVVTRPIKFDLKKLLSGFNVAATATPRVTREEKGDNPVTVDATIKRHMYGVDRPMLCGNRYGLAVEDRDEVTCQRCLKMLGRLK